MKRKVGWPLVVAEVVNLEDNLVFLDWFLSRNRTPALEEPVMMIFNG